MTFADGATAEIDAVVWATGYRDRSDWVEIPEVTDAQGSFIQQRGISPIPGLAFVGRSWQWTRGSALLAGVGADAAYVAERVVGTTGGVSSGHRPEHAPSTAEARERGPATIGA